MQTFLQSNPTVAATVASLLSVAFLMVSFFAFEPLVAHGITDTFVVSQSVTSEISFKTAPTDVSMTPALQGITGGTAYGTSTVAIITNNTTGYNMTIAFASTTAMRSEVGISSDIDNYTPAVGGTPDFSFSVGVNDAEFAYTINSVTTPGDIDSRFKDDGAACNTGSGTTVNTCWYGTADATSAVTLINRTTATPGTGATSTIVFRVGITSNPSPAIAEAMYYATATLTAVTN